MKVGRLIGDEGQPGEWANDAACLGVDPEIFYPERGAPPSDAYKVCASCPVVAECLDYALQSQERFGVWGGASGERRKLINRGNISRQRHLAALTKNYGKGALDRCPQGHLLSETNGYVRPSGGRMECRICTQARKTA